MPHAEGILAEIKNILSQSTPELPRNELESFIQRFIETRDEFKRLAQSHRTPLYVFDRNAFLRRIDQFRTAFKAKLDAVDIYYAVKSNNNPKIAETAVAAGLGLDVSSGAELEMGLKAGSERILFSGPGKTDEELSFAVEHAESVTVLVDSFGELNRLSKIAESSGRRVAIGVRLCAEEKGLWKKFGIPLGQLEKFVATAKEVGGVVFKGLQFHTSWNMNPDKQVGFIERLSDQLKKLDRHLLSSIEFLDIGGGIWPECGEWLQEAGTPEGRLLAATSSSYWPTDLRHYRIPSQPISTFAARIGESVRKHIYPIVNCSIFMEPGRWLCHDALHMLVTVADKKAEDVVITDGGTNMVGWDRFETDFFPVINLSQPGTTEHECAVYGSLCTPHDIWGYSYFGNGIADGDVLLIPTQGAYTFSLRQEFIKRVPKFITIE